MATTAAEILSVLAPSSGGERGLFADYARGRRSVVDFFATAPDDLEGIGRIAKRLAEAGHPQRSELCDALADYNRRVGNGDAALAKIKQLRDPNTFAVLTGQQAGFLTGPLYTIYKALTAVSFAEHLNDRLAPYRFVPVFWIASDDHDLGEINHLNLPHRAEGITECKRVRLPLASNGRSARQADLTPQEWAGAMEPLRGLLPNGGERLASWAPAGEGGVNMAEQFARAMSALFGDTGLILCEPAEVAFLYADTVERVLADSQQVGATLRETSKEIRAAGYKPPVDVEERFTGIFLSDDGRRQKLLMAEAGIGFALNNTSREVSLEEVKCRLSKAPQDFSGSVLVRPLLQDVVFPNIAYIAGPSEVCYFAQLRALYRYIGLEMPAIIPRFSATLIDPRTQSLLAKFGLSPDNLDPTDLSATPPTTDETPNAAAGVIRDLSRDMLPRLQAATQDVIRTDPTQERPFRKALARIEGDMEKLAARADTAAGNAAGIGERQWESIVNFLRPNGRPQERVYNISYFVEQYGPAFIEQLRRLIDPTAFGHRLIGIGGAKG